MRLLAKILARDDHILSYGENWLLFGVEMVENAGKMPRAPLLRSV